MKCNDLLMLTSADAEQAYYDWCMYEGVSFQKLDRVGLKETGWDLHDGTYYIATVNFDGSIRRDPWWVEPCYGRFDEAYKTASVVV